VLDPVHILLPIVVGCALLWLVSRRRDLRQIDDPFVAAVLFLVAFWVVGSGFGPLHSASIQASGSTIALILLSAAAFVAGGLASMGRPIPIESHQMSAHSHAISRPILVLLMALFCAGLATAFVLFAVMGGPAVLGTNVEDARIEARRGLGFLVIATISLVTLPALVFVAEAARRRSGRLPAALGLTVGVVVLGLLGQRYPVVVLILGAAWLVLTTHNRLPSRRSIIVLGILVVAGLVVGGILRAGEAISTDLFTARLTWLGYVNTANIETLVQLIPDRIGYLFGRGYLIDLAVLVPGPQPNFGEWLKTEAGLDFPGGGITIGLIGESYANWGPVVAIAAMLGAGWSYARVRRVLTPHDSIDRAFVFLLSMSLMSVLNSGIVSVALYDTAPLVALYVLTLVLRSYVARGSVVPTDPLRTVGRTSGVDTRDR
jgi:oligosaccharide repeat unit polymerase